MVYFKVIKGSDDFYLSTYLFIYSLCPIFYPSIKIYFTYIQIYDWYLFIDDNKLIHGFALSKKWNLSYLILLIISYLT